MERLSKAKAKWIRSLRDKKCREEAHAFVVEGKKMVAEAIQVGWKTEMLVGVREDLLPFVKDGLTFVCSEAEMQSMSALDQPEGILAVLSFPGADNYQRVRSMDELPLERCFWLDGIQDPGNLGTLVRIADWFGFSTILCGPGTADCFNSKALRASMGSVFRVRLIYVQEWEKMVKQYASRILIADMDGIPAESASFSTRPYLYLGNEANGVSKFIESIAGLERVTIPRIGAAESLNVAISGGILAYLSSAKS